MTAYVGSIAASTKPVTLQTLDEFLVVWSGGTMSSTERVIVGPSRRHPYSARDLLKMSLEERRHILEAACVEAARVYSTDPNLAGFDAFGEQDLYDETP